MADEFLDNEKKIALLKAKLLKIKSTRNELQEQKIQKLTRNKYLDAELNQKQQDFTILERFLSSTSGNNDQNEKKTYNSQASKLLEKPVLEKFSYHTDKYFRYIESEINKESEQQQANDLDEQYQAPPPTCAIQVKFLKTQLPNGQSEMGVPGDDPDYVTQTFRYTKQDTFENLRKVALAFWEINGSSKFVSHQHNDQLQQEKSKQTITAQQEGGESSKLNDGTTALPISGIGSSSSRSKSGENEKIENRYEFVTDELEPIVKTQYIERFLNDLIQQQNKMYLSVILRQRKSKQRHKKGDGDVKNQGISQVKSQGVSHISVNNPTQTIPQSNQQGQSNNHSKVSGPEDVASNSQYNQLVQEDESDIEDEDNQEEEKRRLKISLYKKYTTFFRRFPLLRKMFMIDPKNVESRGVMIDREIKPDKKGMTCDDNNFCVILMLVTMFVLNFLFMYFLEDGPYAQTHYRRIKSLLSIGDVGTSGSFMDISKISDLDTYFTNFSRIPYQLMSKNSDFRISYDFIGAIRIRQQRTKTKQCDYPQRTDKQHQINCYYDTISADTSDTNLIGDGSQPWMQYRSAGDLGISRITSGKFNDYDASGFILDIEKSEQTLLNYKTNVINKMFNHPSYLIESVIAQIMTFTIRNRNDGALIFVELLVEYTESGLFPSIPTIIPFNVNVLGSGLSSPYSVIAQQSLEGENPIDFNVGIILYVITIFKIFLGIFFSLFQLIKGFNYLGDKKVKGCRYFISITFVLNLCILYVIFKGVDLALQQKNMDYDVLELYEKEEYIDLGDLSSHYQSIVFVNTIGLCFVLLRMFMLFNFFRSFEAAITAVEQYYLQIFASLFLLAFVLVGYSMISMSIYGQYINFFSTFIKAFTSLLLILTDCQNLDQFYQYDIILGTVFMIIFYFIFYTFMFNILAVMYIDSYRLVIVDQGELVQDSWSSDDVFKYFTIWIPQSCKKKFNKALDIVQNQNK